MKTIAIPVLLLLTLLPGCHLLGSGGGEPTNVDPLAAPPAEEGQHYLKSGPMTGVERGPGDKTLLSDFVETTKRLNEQKALIASLKERIQLLDKDKKKLESKLESETNLRLGAEAERDAAREELKEKNVQVLNLALQKTRSDKERYEVLIAKNELEELNKICMILIKQKDLYEELQRSIARAKEIKK